MNNNNIEKSIHKTNENINIVVVSDDNYAQHLGVMLFSLLDNSKYNNLKNIYIIDDNISQINKTKLRNTVQQFGAKIIFKQINNEKYKNFKVSNHISLATYYRISIPEIVDSSIKKVIYLDCDLIVKNDICELWQTDISDYCIGAVEIPKSDRPFHLGLPLDSGYFNSGVMVINLEKWRKDNISDKVVDYLKENKEKILLWDQDGLNAILFYKWQQVHPKWNLQTKFFKINYDKMNLKDQEYLESIENPSIIHYTGSSKPWQYLNKHPLKNEYYKYLKKTYWKKYNPEDKNLKNVIKIFIRKYFPRSAKIALKTILKTFHINY
jgi:lipopolysaccharide biosynthesis glycosyltransferase